MRKGVTSLLFLVIIVGLCGAGCSGGAGGSNQVGVVTGEEGLETAGFPVGEDFVDYEPVAITVTQPLAGSIIPQDQSTLSVRGYLSRADVSPAELADVELYVNGVPTGVLDDHSFEVAIPINDKDAPFFTISLNAVDTDGGGFRTDERVVVLLGEANPFGAVIEEAVRIDGDGAFMQAVLGLLLREIDGRNLARMIPDIPLPLSSVTMCPRAFMLQGLQLAPSADKPKGFLVEQGDDGVYEIVTDIQVQRLVIEFSLDGSVFPEGRNFVNLQVNDLMIQEGLTFALDEDSSGVTLSAYIRDGVVVTGEEMAPDTPLDPIPDMLLDLHSFVIEVLNALEITDFKPGLVGILEYLLQQTEGGYEVTVEDLSDLTLSDDHFACAVTLETKQTIGETYATPDNDGVLPDLSHAGTNSAICISDDVLNQLLASTFLGYEMQANIDLDELLQQLLEGSNMELWTWLKQFTSDRERYPELVLTTSFPTPPVLDLSTTGQGILRLRDIAVDASVYDEILARQVCLFRVSIDRDLALGWGGEGLELELESNPTQRVLFNRLSPLIFTSEITNFHGLLGDILTQLIEKVGLLGLQVRGLDFSQTGYMKVLTEVSSETDLTMMQTHVFNAGEFIPDFVPGLSDDAWGLWLQNMATGLSSTGYAQEDNGVSVLDEGLSFVITEGSDLTWGDSLTFTFEAPEGQYITGIALDPHYLKLPNEVFDESFAVLCVTRSFSEGGDGLADSDEEGDASVPLVPASLIAVPLEIDQPAAEGEDPGAVTLGVSPSTQVGIGLRIKKTPCVPYDGFTILEQIQLLIDHITVYVVDVNLE